MSVVLFEQTNLGQVNQIEKDQGFPIIIINHPQCQARLSLYGGQVLAWQPQKEQEVFWLSDSAIYQQGKAIRGGIPLCWPWFGPYQNTNQHGFARQVLWQLDDISVDEQGVNLLISWQGENMNALWPHAAKLEQRLFFGKTFEQSLIMHNLSAEEISYTGALHSYFRVSSPDNVTVPNLSTSEFDDKLTDERVIALNRENCRGPIDSIYYCAEDQQLVDSAWRRVINIQQSHCQQWVLWNPGIATAAKMPDVHLGGEQEYVCLEAANTQWQKIPPNKSVFIKQIISINRF